MNEKSCFTIVTPLDPAAQKLARDKKAQLSLRATIWSQAAERLKPLLGRTCSCFSPAMRPFGMPMYLPYGGVLGGVDAQQFLLCYLFAREQQEKEIDARNQDIRSCGMLLGQFHVDKDTAFTVSAFRSDNPELKSHIELALRFFSDDITAAASLYYLGFESNYITEQQEQEIMSNLGANALCVAELQPLEGKP